MTDGILAGIRDLFNHGNPVTSPKPVTDDDLRTAYKQQESITDKLPWIDLVGDQGKTVLLEDAQSVGAVFDLSQLAVEGRSADFLVAIRNALQQFIRESCDRYPKGQSPWVFSVYAKRERTRFRDFPQRVKAYANKVQKGERHPFTDHYIDKIFTPHIEDMSVDRGLFKDALTNEPWGGSQREIRLVVYRRISRVGKQRLTPEKALDQVCRKIEMNLQAAQVHCRRLTGLEIRQWLARMLNPSPASTGGDVKAFCEQMPDIRPETRPVDWSLADDVTSRKVRSDLGKGIWWFDDIAHSVLTVERLRSAPEIGQLSAERILGGESAGA